MSMSTPRLSFLAVLLSAAACAAAAQPATAEAAPETPSGVGIKVSFRPSVAIVVGIFTMIFSLTFLLLMYAKFCHPSSAAPAPPRDPAAPADGLPLAVPASEGVSKPVIESLPFFRFAALRGAREGLECAVCLARFDDADLLRLLPRCRHAFHLDCVDRWLESKASCPLCRTRVDPDDAALGLKYAASARFVFGGSERFDEEAPAPGRDLLDIFVERVPSSRMDAPTPTAAPQCLDRHKHRIVVSDVVFKSRWSEINSADLVALDAELLRSMSSGRFPIPDDVELELELYGAPADQDEAPAVKEETERKRLLEVESSRGRGGGRSETAVDAARMISSGVRSMSEMVSLPRLRTAVRERLAEEERARRRWVPIARRTARWFAGREQRNAKGEGDDDEEEGAVDAPPSHV